jgi:F-type H+-transporting ATPase subunit b
MEQLLENFSLDLFVKQTILFLVLIFIMVRFAWKPILKALNDREEGIKNALDSAEEAKKQMQNITADNDRILKEARAEREAMLKEAREIKEKTIADAKEEAKAQADKLIKQAQEAFETEKQAAIVDLKNQVATLSVEIAEKVVREELSDQKKQLKLVEDMLSEATLN